MHHVESPVQSISNMAVKHTSVPIQYDFALFLSALNGIPWSRSGLTHFFLDKATGFKETRRAYQTARS